MVKVWQQNHTESVPMAKLKWPLGGQLAICNLEQVPSLNCVGRLQHFVAILKANISNIFKYIQIYPRIAMQQGGLKNPSDINHDTKLQDSQRT